MYRVLKFCSFLQALSAGFIRVLIELLASVDVRLSCEWGAAECSWGGSSIDRTGALDSFLFHVFAVTQQ